jgi:hypothetical protein
VLDCDQFMIEFAKLPGLRVAAQRNRLHALRAACTDFTEIARLGNALKLVDSAPEGPSHCLPPSGVCHHWVVRYTALVQRVEDKCRQLALAEDSEPLMVLATKLAELRVLDVAALAQPVAIDAVHVAVPAPAGSVPASKLVDKCRMFACKYERLRALSSAIEQRDKLQRKYDALVSTCSDFELLGRLSKLLTTAKSAAERLHWRGCELDCLTFPARLSALVQTVTAKCKQLAYSEDFDALATLAAKLDELKALEQAAPPRAWFIGPLRCSGVFSFVPPTADAPAAIAHTVSDEGDKESANDPVHMPPAPGPVAGTEEQWANDAMYVAPAIHFSEGAILTECC